MKKPILCMLVLALNAGAVQALEKDEVLVVYNRNFIASGDLARYYMRKRNIPKGNILALDTVTVEGMSRDRFVKGIQIPVERWLSSHKANAKIRCIVLMRGVPLKVDRVVDPEKQKAYRKADREVRTIEKSKKALEARKKHLEEQAGSDPERARASRKAVEEINTRLTHLIVKLAEAGPRRDAAKKENDEFSKNTNASVDSELSVMFCRNNPIRKWLPNLLFYKAWVVPNRERYPKVFMVCRLDGPSDDAVKRIIDDSVAVEKIGLKGMAYFDARGLVVPTDPEKRKRASYAIYDQWIRDAAKMVENAGVKTVLDNRGALFASGSCRDAALYCGWYSLAKYVPAFEWNRGAVGFHIASAEATSLRGKEVWCKRMIDEGVAGTLGPVGEPYLFSFPRPSAYFGFLLTGKYTAVEAFWYSVPWTSWMQTCIGDPLYTPFKKNPRMTGQQLQKLLGITTDRPPDLNPDLREMPVPKKEPEEEKDQEKDAEKKDDATE